MQAAQSKPMAISSMSLDSRARGYMMGHQVMQKAELKAALEAAQADPDLKGSLRSVVIERYQKRISGEKI